MPFSWAARARKCPACSRGPLALCGRGEHGGQRRDSGKSGSGLCDAAKPGARRCRRSWSIWRASTEQMETLRFEALNPTFLLWIRKPDKNRCRHCYRDEWWIIIDTGTIGGFSCVAGSEVLRRPGCTASGLRSTSDPATLEIGSICMVESEEVTACERLSACRQAASTPVPKWSWRQR